MKCRNFSTIPMLCVSVHVGAKKPGFSYRETSLATEKHLRANLLCLWSLKNPVSDPPQNEYMLYLYPAAPS